MMERTVFADEQFLREARRFVLFRADVTDSSFLPQDVVKAVNKYETAPGGQMPLPTILFLDSRGVEMRGLRTIGAQDVGEFVANMKRVR